MDLEAVASPQDQEEALIQRLVELQTAPPPSAAAAATAKQAWYADAYAFLQRHGGEHWWCRHGDITAGLAEVLRYHAEQPLVQGIWRAMSAQLAACTDCVNAYHAAQDFFVEQYSAESSGPLLLTLRTLDGERVAAALGRVQALGEGLELPPELIAALFEALSYDALLEDAEVADGLAAALCTLSARYDLALAEPGGARYPGAYRMLAHPSADARRLAAGMVRIWGPFENAAALEAVLPTLQHWAELLDGSSPAASSSVAGAGARARLPFRPPAVAVWRALHGVLPLLQGDCGAALVQHVPGLVSAVLDWVGGRRDEGELCTWFAVSCWAHLLAAAGPEALHHTAVGPAAIVQQLAATAAGSASERLHKAAAEAVAGTLLHAAGGGSNFTDAVAALRRGLLFLLHDIPQASVTPALQVAQQAQQAQHAQQQPGFSQLTAAVAEAAAFSTLLQLLSLGGRAAEAALCCAHFWVQPMCASLRQRGSDGAAAQPQLRNPALYAAADKAALRLAAALLAGEAAALSGRSKDGDTSDVEVAAVAAAAVEQGGAWQCVPALWHALASATGSQECSALLLGAAAALSQTGSHGGTAAAAAAASGGAPLPAGFSAPVLASTLGSEIAAARRPLPPQALRGYCLHEDASKPSPAAVAVHRGPAFLAEQLQQAAAEHLALLAQCCRGSAGAAAPAGQRHWAADPQQWQSQMALPLARLLLAPNLLLRAAAEEYAMAATRQGSAPAAASVLAQLHPAAAPLLQPLLAKLAKQPGRAQQAQQATTSNRFVRQQPGAGRLSGQATQQQRAVAPGGGGMARWLLSTASDAAGGRTKPGSAAAASAPAIIDLTDSPRAAESASSAPAAAAAAAAAAAGAAPSATASASAAAAAAGAASSAPAAAPAAAQPPGAKATTAAAPQATSAQQQQPEVADAPWFLQWPSKQQQQQQPAAQQAQRQPGQPAGQQAQRQPGQPAGQRLSSQQQQQQAQRRQNQQQQSAVRAPSSADDVDMNKVWPSAWPSRTAAAPSASKQAPAIKQQGGEHALAGNRSQQPPAQRQQQEQPPPEQQKQQQQRQQQQKSAQQEIDVSSLWPDKWPARKPSRLKPASTAASQPVAVGRSGSWADGRGGSRGGSRGSSPERTAGMGSSLGQQRRPSARSSSPEPLTRGAGAAKRAGAAGTAGAAGAAPFRIPKRTAAEQSGSAAPRKPGTAAAKRQPAAAAAAAAAAPAQPSRPLSRVASLDAAAEQSGRGQPAPRQVSPVVQQPEHKQQQQLAPQQQRRPSLARELQLLEEDDSLFAGLDAVPAGAAATAGTAGAAGGPGLRRTLQPQPAAPVRRTVRLAAPPPATGGRRGARAADPAAMPLWQQRRTALGAAGRQEAAAAPLMSMDQLLQQLLSWDPSTILSGGLQQGGSGKLEGLTVPTRFDSLGQYTRVFSRLLLEELRAHLQQAAEEAPAAAALCSSSGSSYSGRDRGSMAGSSGGAPGWPEVAAALSASGAVQLHLQEVQRQSDLHVLRFEPSSGGGEGPAASSATGQPQSAAEFSRCSGIRAEDLLLLVSRPSRGASAAAAAAAAGAPSPRPAMLLAAVDSVQQQQLPEGRQTQGKAGRARQLQLSTRANLRGVGGGAAAAAGPGSSWLAVRLMSLTPHLRQLQALVAAQRLPPLLLAELLSPGTTAASQQPPPQLSEVQPLLPPPLLAVLQAQYNSSQQTAIAAAALGYKPASTSAQGSGGATGSAGGSRADLGSSSGGSSALRSQGRQQLVLVQGPPGTGKTSAILGMLSAFLAANLPRGSSSSGKASSRAGKSESSSAAAAAPGRRPPAVLNPTVRVLLCAQSNAAVDELCTRLAARGVMGRDGAQRHVSLVRFGPLEAVSPDAAVHHIDAAAAAMEVADAGLGETSGQSSQLAPRLQSLRQQLRLLQQQIDACDEAVEESRERKRRRLERRQGGREERRRSGRERRGGSRESSREPSEAGSSSMVLSDSGSEGGSDIEDGGGRAVGEDAAAASPFPSSQEVRQQLGPLLQRKQQLKKEAAAAAAALQASSAAASVRRKEIRAAVVAQSEVVAATLSSAGGELLQLMPRAGGAPGWANGGSAAPLLGFDAIIVDEAAQALEPSALIALQLLAPGGRLVLVGDPQQLPATVVSRAAAAAALSQSLFERLMQAGYPLCMLRQQYRMHPAISAWPSTFFYQGKLRDAAAVAVAASGGGGRAAPWHEHRSFPPLAFWDVHEGLERGGAGSSLSNAEEAEVAWTLYAGLVERYRRDVGDVVVLTPYKAQLAQLRRTFQQRGGSTALDAVQFATVDGFQGREADVVIFSCVRAHTGGGGSGSGVGFLSDVRRMNVALTRARRSLWIVGHADTLAGCQPWQELMAHCRRQHRLFDAAPPYSRLVA